VDGWQVFHGVAASGGWRRLVQGAVQRQAGLAAGVATRIRGTKAMPHGTGRRQAGRQTGRRQLRGSCGRTWEKALARDLAVREATTSPSAWALPRPLAQALQQARGGGGGFRPGGCWELKGGAGFRQQGTQAPATALPHHPHDGWGGSVVGGCLAAQASGRWASGGASARVASLWALESKACPATGPWDPGARPSKVSLTWTRSWPRRAQRRWRRRGWTRRHRRRRSCRWRRRYRRRRPAGWGVGGRGEWRGDGTDGRHRLRLRPP
jgi:hypothetical protein